MPFLPVALVVAAIGGVVAVVASKKKAPKPKPIDVPAPTNTPTEPANRGLRTTLAHYNGVRYGLVEIYDARKAYTYLMGIANELGLERSTLSRNAILQLLFSLEPEFRQIPLEQLGVKMTQMPEPNDEELGDLIHMVERDWSTLGQLELVVDEQIDARGW